MSERDRGHERDLRRCRCCGPCCNCPPPPPPPPPPPERCRNCAGYAPGCLTWLLGIGALLAALVTLLI